MSKKEKRLTSKKRKLEALVNVTLLNDEDKIAEKKKSTSVDKSEKIVDNHAGTAEVQRDSSEVKDDIKRLQEEYRTRRKLIMALPKLFLNLENIKRPLMEEAPEQEGKEEEINDNWKPVLFFSDMQRLLLYCIQGNLASYKPRWCSLLRPDKVKHTVVIAVDDVGISEVQQYKECLQYVHTNFDMSVELACPMQYGRTVTDELFNVLRGRERLIGWGVAEETDPERSKFSRLDLLLNPQQMAEENYPLPVSYAATRNYDYVFSCDAYKKVDEKSPIFAVDCEMCLNAKLKQVLTRVAIVDEKRNVLYDSLVKPNVPIRDYLTRYSGITKKMLDPVTTSLEDVQNDLRKIFPPDAILCGQSMQSDLHALKMFHPYVIDTSVIFNLSGFRHKKTGLRALAARFLGRDIQNNPSGHNPCEDAIATMDLVNLKLQKGMNFGDVILGGPLDASEESQKNEENDSTDSVTPAAEDSDVPQTHDDLKIDSENNLLEERSDSGKSDTEEIQSSVDDTDAKNKWSEGLKLVFFQRPSFVRNESFFSIAKWHNKTVAIIGRKDDIKQYKDMTTTIVGETDKIISKRVIASYDKYDLTYCNLNSFTRCLNQNSGEDLIKEKLEKIDHRLKKMTKDLIAGTVVAVLFTGRASGSETHNAKLFVKTMLNV